MSNCISNTRIYGLWEAMKQRCYNKNNHEYNRYGGRGITICDEWKNSSETFINWAYKNGYDDASTNRNCTLDRIDNNGDYCPENCHFVTQKKNSRNMERCHIIEYNGEKHHWLEWCEILGISKKGVEHSVARYGLTYPEAFDRYLYTQWNPHTQSWEPK